MSKDIERIEVAKRFIKQTIDYPPLAEVEGQWYIFEQEGRVPKVLLESSDGFFIDEPYTVSRIKELGWTRTPVLVYKLA